MTWLDIFAIGSLAWLVCAAGFLYVWSRKPRGNVKERDTDRSALDSDARLDEARDYTTNHVRAGTAYGEKAR